MIEEPTPTAEPEDRLGLTEEQWERFQAYTHGFGEQDENGVDVSLLRENLRLTPSQRLQKGLRTLARDQNGALIELRLAFHPIAEALYRRNVRYLLIGDLAMQCQGSAYLTEDLTLFYARETANLRALADALAPLHPRFRGVDEDLPVRWNADTLRGGMNFSLVTDAADLDLLGLVPGAASFDAVWERSTEVELFGVPVRVASLDDLIEMKRATCCTKDTLHLMELERLRHLLAERLNA